MTRNNWLAIYANLQPGELRERIQAAGRATTAEEFDVWVTLEEAAASGDERLIEHSVNLTEESFDRS